MKIVYIANVRLPTEKAHGLQIMKMCEAFARAGAEVELVVPYRKNMIRVSPFEYWGVEQIFSIITLGRRDFFSIKSLPRRFAFALNILSFAFTLVKYIRRTDASAVFYTRDREVAWFLPFLRRHFIAEIHFLPRMPFMHRYFLRRALLIVTLTSYLKRIIVSWSIPDRRVAVLPDAVDTSLFRRRLSRNEARQELGLPKDKFIVVYAGQLLLWKGIDTLLRAAGKLDKRFLVVLVGGSREEHGHFASLAGETVRFIERQSQSEVVRWLSAADAAVLPNSGHFSISRFYTSPLKLYEYLAIGLPVISADLPALREALGENEAVFFKADDPLALAAVIRDLADDGKFRARLTQMALKKIRAHTWELRAAAIIRLIERAEQKI